MTLPTHPRRVVAPPHGADPDRGPPGRVSSTTQKRGLSRILPTSDGVVYLAPDQSEARVMAAREHLFSQRLGAFMLLEWTVSHTIVSCFREDVDVEVD
jgi:hypothetical protein